MKNMMKRVLAVLLSAAMVIGLIFPNPMRVKAADDEVSITLTIKDADENPVAVEEVTAVTDGGQPLRFETASAASGVWTYSGPVESENVSRYTISVVKEGWHIQGDPETFTIYEPKTLNLTVTLVPDGDPIQEVNYTVDASAVFTHIINTYGSNALAGVSLNILANGEQAGTIDSDTAYYKFSGSAAKDTVITYTVSNGTYLLFVGEGPSAETVGENAENNNFTVAADAYTANLKTSDATYATWNLNAETELTYGGADTDITVTFSPAQSGWENATVEFTTENPNVVTVENNKLHIVGASIIPENSNTPTPVNVTATIKINGTAVQTLTSAVTVNKKQVTPTIDIIASPVQSEAHSWKDPVEFTVSVDPSERINADGALSDVAMYINGTYVPWTDGKIVYQPQNKNAITVKATLPAKETTNIIYADAEAELPPYNPLSDTPSGIGLNEEWTLTDGFYVNSALDLTYGDSSIEIGTLKLFDSKGNEITDFTAGYDIVFGGNSDISVNPDNGKLIITVKDVGDITFSITSKADANYNASSPAIKLKITGIQQYKLQDANVVVTAPDAKLYDGTNLFNTNIDGAVSAILQNLPYDEDANKTVNISASLDDPNAGDRTASFTITLDSSIANYYDLSGLTTVTTQKAVTINKRPLYIVVGDAAVEWIYADTIDNINAKSPISLSIQGKTDVSGLIDNDSQLVPTYPPLVLYTTDAGVANRIVSETPYGDVLRVDDSVASTGLDNYYFDYTEGEGKYTKGDLIIKPEVVNDVPEHLTINNDASTNMYQTSDYSYVYYKDGDSVAVFTIDNLHHDLDPYYPDTDYTQVLVNGDDVISGYKLPQAVMETDGKVTFVLSSGNGHTTEPFTIQFTRDNTPPSVTVTLDANTSVVTDFTKAITFNLFDNLYSEKETVRELKAVMSVEDPEEGGVSGIKSWYYAIVNTAKSSNADKDINYNGSESTINSQTVTNKDELQALLSGITWAEGTPDGAEITEYIGRVLVKTNEDGTPVYDVEAGNYIVFVLAVDNVNNAVLYSSKGAIIDNIDMTIISMAYDEMTAKNKPDFFNEDVDLLITVTENTSGVYSGVATLTETVTQDGEKGNPQELISAEKVDDTLAEIKEKYGEITVPSTIAAQDGSKEVTVDYTATDYAGNVITASKSFVIDPVAPEMTMELSSSASRLNGKYYKANVTVTTTITERYLDLANDLVFTINIDGKDNVKKFGELANGQLGITAIKVVKQTDESDDEQQTVVTIEFGEDHEYLVSAAVMDKAGNEAEAEADVFVVDKTAPVATVTYYGYGDGSTFKAGTSEATRYYLAGQNGFSSFRAVIAVDELNFSDGKTVNANYKVTAVDSEGAAASGVDTAKYDTDAKAFSSWKSQKLTVDYTADANYTMTFDYTDLAGNPVKLDTNYITLDTVIPEGTVTVYNMVNGDASRTWEDLLSTISFGLFGKDYVGSTMTSKDLTAGVASTQYLTTSELLTKTALAARNDWTDYVSALTLAANENVIVYEKVTDKAGNVEYYSSENIVVDNVDPAPVVTITPSVPAWNKGVYAASDNPGFDIEVTDPITNGAYSGLQTITYKITAEGVEETGELASFTKGSHEQSWKGHVNIDPAKFYSNNVEVTVTASDYSTNEATSETRTLKIDSKDPIVSFSFDNSDARNGKYYNREKTLTITIDERNFDPSYEPTVTSTTGGGWSFSGWSTSGEITTGTVTFSGDSDYTVTFDCYDLAGNKSNTENLEEITVDMTNPVITVSYDNNNASNNKYYRSDRTATIKIEEHNFNAENVTVTITASLNGESIDVPVVSEWNSNDDTHIASVKYPGDGDYTFDIEYVDLAGNDAADYAGDEFTVDKTAPELRISGVENKSANNGTVAPVIDVKDINFNNANVTYTLTGANTGEVDVTDMVMANVTEQGTTITFKNFPDGMDDIYTLTAKAVDMAGNETTKTITFSVNRDGSTYIINDYTKSLLDKGFTNDPKDIVITEINVDTLEFVELSYTKDGQVVKLEEGKDYTVEVSGGDGEWKQYTYTIKASAFAEEGEYSINIYSEDTATNSSTNKAKAMSVDFIVDKTAPTMAVANLDDNGRYQEDAHTFTLTVKDNSVLDKVEIYLDGELWKTIDGKDLAAANGVMDVVISESRQYQDIQLVAYDAAGNKTDALNYHVLVTSSGWIQFYNNKPLFGGSIAGVVAVGGGLAALLARRKKKEEDK